MKTRTTILSISMKTMMELLIRLQQVRLSSLRAAHNNQLTAAEKNSIRFFKSLVRDCLPAEVLIHYDRLKETGPKLLECPEVFAMAVLVSTYRSLSPAKRRKLLSHFADAPPAVESVTRRNRPVKRGKLHPSRLRPCRTAALQR